MIRHIVIIQFEKKSTQDYPSLMEKTRPLIEGIPGIISYEIYLNESKYVPEDVFSLGVEINFEDNKALDVFMDHLNHFEANALFEEHLADPPFMVLTHEVKDRLQ